MVSLAAAAPDSRKTVFPGKRFIRHNDPRWFLTHFPEPSVFFWLSYLSGSSPIFHRLTSR